MSTKTGRALFREPDCDAGSGADIAAPLGDDIITAFDLDEARTGIVDREDSTPDELVYRLLASTGC